MSIIKQVSKLVAKTGLKQVIRATQLYQKKQYQQAEEKFLAFLRQNPQSCIALLNLGRMYLDLGDFPNAVSCFDRCIKSRENEIAIKAGAMSNLGLVFRRMGKVPEWLSCWRKCLDLAPHNADMIGNWATALMFAGDWDAALGLCHEVVKHRNLAPDRMNLAIAMLTTGDWKNGWKHYEARWDTPGFTSTKYNTNKPQWRGKIADVTDKRLLVWCEQGAGDTLMCLRYLALLVAHGVSVTALVPPELKSIVETTGATAVYDRAANIAHDLHCPTMSLPLLFNTTPETIPQFTLPIQKIENRKQGLRVGLCWAGSILHGNDRWRSIPIEQWDKILAIPKVQFISLQKDAPGTDFGRFKPLASETFMDTAKVMAGLDLIITVDTSIAHLAGVIGKPVWMLTPRCPDFRWMHEGLTVNGKSTDTQTPWYPSMRLFRAPRYDRWDVPIQKVAEALKEII